MTKSDVKTGTGTANFTGDCGECTSGYYSATCAGGMQPNQTATVNGSSPENCIVGNDNAKVFQIDLQYQAGPYDYQIRVEAQGPDSPWGGSLYLAFKDESNDVYYLRIYNSSREWHSLSYNSKQPNITTIYWSDYSFTVKGTAARKAHFKVVSPADTPK